MSRPPFVPLQSQRSHLLAYFLMAIAVFCMSTSVIFIKSSKLDVSTLTTGRLLFSALILAPVLALNWRRYGAHLPEGWLTRPALPGLFLAGHLLSWAIGARLTTSANATLAVNTAPLVMPFLLYWLARERVSRQEIFGTLIAFSGLIVLVVADAGVDVNHLKGDVVCLASMLLLAVYLTLSRKNIPAYPSPWFYTVPLYLVAGLVCLPFCFTWEQWAPVLAWDEALRLLGLVVVPTIFGHGLTMVALQYLRGQIVAVMSLGQFIFSGVMAWYIFGEQPGVMFAVAAVLTLIGSAIVIFGKPDSRPRP